METQPWSEYPNFIGPNTHLSKSEEKELLITSKQLCSIEPADFNLVESRAVYENALKWPPNYAIRIKFLDGAEWQKAWVEKIVTEEIEPHIDPRLSFKFVKREDYADVKTFKFDGYGASLVGTMCQNTGQFDASMKYGFLDFPQSRKFEFKSRVYTIPEYVEHGSNNETGSVIKHEFGHVMGKHHEHQNPIDNPIVWDVDKALKYYTEDPPPWTKKDVYNNIFKRLSIAEVDATPFDPSSIMIYTVLRKLTKNGIGFEKNENVELFKKDDICYIDICKNRIKKAFKSISVCQK